MKRLRASEEDKTLFIEKIKEKLTNTPKAYLEEFEIDDIVKSLCKPPEEIEKPKIMVTTEAYMKMLEMVNQSSVECSWHGLVHRHNNEYFVYDILVFPQINSGTSTTTDEDAFAEWQTDLILDPEFPIEHLRLHGHSHVNMNVFSSGVDDKYQKDLIAKVEDGDYYIFFIMNKKMEICMFLYDFKQQIMFEKTDIDFRIVSGLYDEELQAPVIFENINEWVADELKEKATTERVYSYQKQKPEITKYPQYNEESYFSKATSIFKGARNGFK